MENGGSHDSCFSFNKLYHKNVTVDNLSDGEQCMATNNEECSQNSSQESTILEEQKTKDETVKNENEKQPPEEEQQDVYINYLRDRILKLEIPSALKSFLLYNREI